MGRKIGITEEQLSDLSRFEDSAHFSNEEKLVSHLAVSLTRTPSDVCDELYGELRKRFSERELVELNAAICWENYLEPLPTASPRSAYVVQSPLVFFLACLQVHGLAG